MEPEKEPPQEDRGRASSSESESKKGRHGAGYISPPRSSPAPSFPRSLDFRKVGRVVKSEGVDGPKDGAQPTVKDGSDSVVKEKGAQLPVLTLNSTPTPGTKPTTVPARDADPDGHTVQDPLTIELESYLSALDAYTTAAAALQSRFSNGFLALVKARMSRDRDGELITLEGVTEDVELRREKIKERDDRTRVKMEDESGVEKEREGKEEKEQRKEESGKEKKKEKDSAPLTENDIRDLCDWAKRVSIEPVGTPASTKAACSSDLDPQPKSHSCLCSNPADAFKLLPSPASRAAQRTGRPEPGPVRDWFGGSGSFNPELVRAKTSFDAAVAEIGPLAQAWAELRAREARIRDLRAEVTKWSRPQDGHVEVTAEGPH